MSNANGQHDSKCNMLISLTPDLRQRYKTWCSQQGISMNTGIVAFMETATAKKKYKLQQRILELSK